MPYTAYTNRGIWSLPVHHIETYGMCHKTSTISRILGGNRIVDHSDVFGAVSVGTAPTTSSFSTQHLASMDWANGSAGWDETFQSGDLVQLILEVWWHHILLTLFTLFQGTYRVEVILTCKIENKYLIITIQQFLTNTDSEIMTKLTNPWQRGYSFQIIIFRFICGYS